MPTISLGDFPAFRGLPNMHRILSVLSFGLRLLQECELPDFNWHICRYSAGSWRRGNPCRDGIGAFGSRYVNNPVAQQELLRLREDAVGDRDAILLAAHHLRFIWSG